MDNKKQYKKTIIQFEKITSNEKSIFVHQGTIMIAISKAYLLKVLENNQQSQLSNFLNLVPPNILHAVPRDFLDRVPVNFLHVVPH